MKIAVPKLEKSSYIILVFIFLFFFVSLMVWVARFPGIRRTFIFHASDSDKYRIETRYVPINTPVNKYEYYIQELLLGPVSEHCSPVFYTETRVLSCFLKDSVLYVNLSEDMMKADAFNTDFQSDIDLFKRNVIKNFPKVKQIELFIGGVKPYVESEVKKI